MVRNIIAPSRHRREPNTAVLVTALLVLAIATPAVADEVLPTDEPVPAAAAEPETYSLHIQGTYTTQGHPRFSSAIPDGPQSMKAQMQMAETADVTLFLGLRLGDLELYLDPEADQGFGPSNTYGVAGYTSGEAYKLGLYNPYYRTPRLFGRYVLGLGGEHQAVEAGPNQLGGTQDTDNVTFTFGKFSVVDIFDTNTYAHDPKADFLNWGMLDMGAFDYAAEAWGFTYGAAAEWTQGWWTLRQGVFSLSRKPNDKYLDPDFRQFQTVTEAEERHQIFGQPGKVKALFFLMSGNMGSYADALRLGDATGNTPDTGMVRHRQLKPGGGINVEQQIVPELGAFLKASMNDGTKEEFEFSDINQSLVAGLSLKGGRWGRADDTVGLGGEINAISNQARAYFAAGGMGGIIGDGLLPSYKPEEIIEAYYKIALAPGVPLTLDYQRVTSPGYDAARGPIDLFSFRFHAEY